MDSTSKDSKYTSEAFISQLNKIYSLKENSIFSDEEYKNRKIQFIIDLINKGISQSLDNFLSDILTLKDKNILTVEEIKQIKSSLTSKEIKTEEKQNEDISQSNKYYCGDCKSEIELSQEEIKKNLYICPNCNAINSLDGNSEANVVYEKETEINPKSNDYYCRFCNEKTELEEEDTVKSEIICPRCDKLNSIGDNNSNLNLKEENSFETETNNTNNNIIICKHCKKTFDVFFTIANENGILCPYCGEMNLLSPGEQPREIPNKVIKQQNNLSSKKKLSRPAKFFITLGAILFVLYIGLSIIANIELKETEKKKYELEQKRIKEEKEQLEFNLKNKSSEEINREYDNWQKENKKERENAEWEKKRKEREDEVKRQYNSTEMQKARDRDLQKQKEADQRELDYLKERYLKK